MCEMFRAVPGPQEALNKCCLLLFPPPSHPRVLGTNHGEARTLSLALLSLTYRRRLGASVMGWGLTGPLLGLQGL